MQLNTEAIRVSTSTWLLKLCWTSSFSWAFELVWEFTPSWRGAKILLQLIENLVRFYLSGDLLPEGFGEGLGIKEKKTPCILYLFYIVPSNLDECQTMKMQGVFIYLPFVQNI